MFSISDPAREFLKFSTSKWEMLLLPNSFCWHLPTSIPYLVTFGEGFPCNIHYIFLIYIFFISRVKIARQLQQETMKNGLITMFTNSIDRMPPNIKLNMYEEN